MRGASRACYRGFRLSAGPGVPDVPDWDPYRQPHLRFWVTVTAPNGRRARFRYWSSVRDYVDGKERLDRADLLQAFRCWMEDAQLGALADLHAFCEELGESEPSAQTRKSFQACRRAYRSCQRLGVPLDDPEFLDGLDPDHDPDLVDAVQALALGEDPVGYEG